MEWLYWLCSYIAGTFLTAYVIAKSKGIDLSKEGSGNFGARNIGRVVGSWAFVVTMLGDAVKGAIVVMVGYSLDFSMLTVVIGLICTVLGHVYPFWRKFKGGKGVATGIGGLIFVLPIGALLLAGGFFLLVVITRSSTKGMLGAFAVYAGYFIYEWSTSSIAVFIVIFLVIWANRENIAEKFEKGR
jgi:acyl phosphate:glycerol-3-phosphate acyltransferase